MGTESVKPLERDKVACEKQNRENGSPMPGAHACLHMT